MSLNLPRLWVVATPLGNLGDFSPRAREILSSVDLVLAEDTRRAGLLFVRAGLAAKRFASLHEHNEAEKIPRIVEKLAAGLSAALISDAGTPLLSDPGYRMVRAAREAGLAVSPVPGPSAPLAALCACGLPPQPHVFLGFPPRNTSEIRNFFAPYAELAATLIFFERKDRLNACLRAALAALGPREGCIARELTKIHEEFIFFALEDIPSFDGLLGEITVLLGPPQHGGHSAEATVRALLEDEALAGAKPREKARFVQGLVRGWSVKEVYALLRTPAHERACDAKGV
jgi:16S rRNA (cytidine1402-2'-O)-methyltransferase